MTSTTVSTNNTDFDVNSTVNSIGSNIIAENLIQNHTSHPPTSTTSTTTTGNNTGATDESRQVQTLPNPHERDNSYTTSNNTNNNNNNSTNNTTNNKTDNFANSNNVTNSSSITTITTMKSNLPHTAKNNKKNETSKKNESFSNSFEDDSKQLQITNNATITSKLHKQNNNTNNTNNSNDSKLDEMDSKSNEKKNSDKIALHRIKIPRNLHLLTWDELEFKDDEEKLGAMKLQEILHKDSKIPLNKLPPFEMLRYYIGSFYDIQLATRRWLDSIDMYKEHKFDNISDADLREYLSKISNVMKIGGINGENELVCSLGCKSYIASEFSLNSTFIKAYYLLLHLLTSDLDILRKGVILIGDAEQYSSKNFTYQLVTRFSLFQKVYPIRLARIFVVNGSSFVQTCFNLIKPFLSKFMQQRIFWMQADEFFEGKYVKSELIPNNILDGTFESDEINPLVEFVMQFHKYHNNLEHFKLENKYSKISRRK